jgi:hypothetical protein
MYGESMMELLKNRARSKWWRLSVSKVIAVVSLWVLLSLSTANAIVPSQQQSFPTPSAAASALIGAARNDDLSALASILGPDAKEVISSGDPVADNNARDTLVEKYEQMHRIAYDNRGQVVLYIGADNWPFPIPLVKKDEGWIFDTNSGKEELLYRRIGQNELFTIDVLEDLADAQHEYASEPRDGVMQFARKIQSDAGKHNGLYWPVAAGEPESPIGPLIADATEAGYKTGASAPIPFHGYYYRIITRQGKNVPGGAINYVDQGKMTRGFAFLAYPATYRASGVMTFMINRDGIVVQKDLGPDTAKLANDISEFNPDKTWDQVVQ